MNGRKINIMLDMPARIRSQKARILIHRLSRRGMLVWVEGKGYCEVLYKNIYRKERTWPSSWAERSRSQEP